MKPVWLTGFVATLACCASAGPGNAAIVPDHFATPTRLYAFNGFPSDGQNSLAALIFDSNGALYGTSAAGGTAGYGSVFKLTPSKNGFVETVLHSFRGGNDGAVPAAKLLLGASGVLYGTTNDGGAAGLGTVYELVPKARGYRERVVYSFMGQSDGAHPQADVIADASGSLYGTTASGGTGASGGFGTVFKLTRNGSSFSESVLYRFRGGTDGATPLCALLIVGNGVLYGTTSGGGLPVSSASGSGNGTIFKLVPSNGGYVESVIHRFTGAPGDGSAPMAGLAIASGELVGTTRNGGTDDRGTVFIFDPVRAASEHVIHNFTGGYPPDGQYPLNAVTVDATGAIYGTTQRGGNTGSGVIYKLVNGSLRNLYSFQDDEHPVAGVVLDSTGSIYTTTPSAAFSDPFGYVLMMQQTPSEPVRP